MWEPWRPSRQAVAGIVLVLLAAGAASAAPASGDLVVRGPVAFDGPASFSLDNPTLLLRQPGHADFQGVTFTLQAPQAVLKLQRVEQMCVTPTGAPAVAEVALPALLTPRSALPSADGAVQQVAERVASLPLPSPLSNVAQDATGRAASIAQAPARALDDALAAAAPPGAPPSPIPIPAPGTAPCFDWSPDSHTDTIDVKELRVQVAPTDPYYTIAWGSSDASDAGCTNVASSGNGCAPAAGAPGASTAPVPMPHAHLSARDARTAWTSDTESVPLTAADDQEFMSYAPQVVVPGQRVDTTASDGSGSFSGNGQLALYRAVAHVHGVYASNGTAFDSTIQTGEHREAGYVQGNERRILDFLQIDAQSSTGSFESPGAVRALGTQARASLDGSVAVPEARGALAVGNDTYTLDGSAVKLTGALQATFKGLDKTRAGSSDGKAAPRDAMAMQVHGDAAQVQTAGVRDTNEPAAVTNTALAVGGAAAGLAMLAWFWPSLKFFLAPLYTRIAPDAVLMHGAREKIYRLIRDEPGIHAHEVAARLGLGWGTAVYHLKLLERNSLVVSRHEGRYKRFFVTGDQRIQHREAVALLRNATSRSIATAVAAQPGQIQKQLCQALGVSPSLASWHLQRLEASGLVTAERLGRAVRYNPGPAWGELASLTTEAHAAPAPSPAPGAPVPA
jgi:predicted transcriptional regulator